MFVTPSPCHVTLTPMYHHFLDDKACKNDPQITPPQAVFAYGPDTLIGAEWLRWGIGETNELENGIPNNKGKMMCNK